MRGGERMILPTLNEIATSRDVVEEFRGYNHNLRIGDGEFYDMKNLTSSYYPVLAPRCKRGVYEYPEGSGESHTPNGLVSKDALCYVDGTKLFVNNKEIIGLELSDSPKQLISMGAYIIIMPDKKYVNTKDFTDMGNIEASFPSTEGETLTVTYEMCKIDGTVYEDVVKSSTAPENPTNMQYWIDTSSTPHILKQYSETSSVWNQVATCYIRISAPNIAANFKQYDAVKISGLPVDQVPQLKDLEGVISVLWDAHHDEENPTNDYIVVIGFLDEVITYESQLRLEQKMPVMDFMIESGNRLWGCRYGENNDGEIVNEIYASKLGDFKNWNCFMQTSQDSWYASVGTDGQWTGAITHLGYPLFFKENYVHKVYGNYPANFQIQTTACRGVQKGCGKSLAIVNEVLYYKSRGGICAYDGSLPTEMSSALGEISYSDAVGCGHYNKYYISMKDTEGIYNLFVYDAKKGMWHKEDEIKIDDFCSCDGELYAISNGKIITLLGSGKKDSDAVKWMAETGVIGMYTPDKKYISRLNIRMSLDTGSKIYFYVQYDSFGEWKQLCTMIGTSLRTFTVPVKPHRCDHFRLRIVGEGDARIYSITKTLEQGSDI